MSVAATALKSNITRLAPLVLPLSEQLLFAGNFVARKVRDLTPYKPMRSVCLEQVDCTQGGVVIWGVWWPVSSTCSRYHGICKRLTPIDCNGARRAAKQDKRAHVRGALSK